MARWLANFGTVLVQPRRAMRAILDHPPDRMVVPLVLLAIVSAFMKNFNIHAFRHVVETKALPAWVFAAIVACAALLLFVLFLAFSWIAVQVGRFLEGQSDVKSVRSALAWGLAPVIVALVYRIPAAFLMPMPVSRVRIGREMVTVSPGRFAGGCASALAFAFLELLFLTWYLFVASNTLGEAHRFSAWRGLATLLITAFGPLLIVIAALIANGN